MITEIYNPDGKILEFNYNYSNVGIFDYNIEEIRDIKSLKNLSYFKDISPGYFYSSRKYFIFSVINTEYYKDFNLNFLNTDITSNEISDRFNIFKLFKNKELLFQIKYPEKKIIIKALSPNKGVIEINKKIFNILYENQIEEIDVNNLNTLNIKALDNDFVFAIKSKVPENRIIYSNMEIDFNHSLKINNEVFIVYNIDYFNYDYVMFSLEIKAPKESKYEYGINYGYINEKHFEKIPKQNGIKNKCYDLKYYKNKNNLLSGKKLLFVYYVENFNETEINITIQSKYYKQLAYKENTYVKNWGNNLMNIFYDKEEFKLIFYTEKTTIIYNCLYKNVYLMNSYNSFIYYYKDFQINRVYLVPLEFSVYGYIRYLPNKDKNNYWLMDSNKKIRITIFNNTYFNIFFQSSFTDIKERNYFLYLSEKNSKENYDSKIYVLENFYLKNQNNNSEYELITFNVDDLSTDFFTSYSSINLTTQKFNLNATNKEIIFYLIGEAIYDELVYIYTPRIIKTFNNTQNEKENENDNENNNNHEEDKSQNNKKNNKIVKIILIILIPIIITSIIIIIGVIIFKKKKTDLEMEIKEDNSLKKGFNISMSTTDKA